MNERFWRTENDPHVLLSELFPNRSHGSIEHQTRKCRRYLLECARRQWDRLPGVCRTLVALAEVFAESPRQEEEIRAALVPIAEQLMNSSGEESDLLGAETALSFVSFFDNRSPSDVLARPERDGRFIGTEHAPPVPLTPAEWRGLAALVYLPFVLNTPPFTWVPREFHSTALLREIYYNPYLFVPFDAEWRTTNVLAIAQGMYDTREFSAMPILADALQDAGCTEDAILKHCRDKKHVHVRGCWVLDRVLSRR